MQLVERHIFREDVIADELCFLSKNLYNYVNYILRQVYLENFDAIPEYSDLVRSFKFKDKTYKTIDEYALVTRLTHRNQVDYRALPSQTNQQVIKLVYRNWKSFFKSIKTYSTNPEKFKSKPKLPGYKDKVKGRNISIFTNQNSRIKDGYLFFPASSKMIPIKTKIKAGEYQQVRIVPQATCYIIEIVYNKEEVKHENLDSNKFLSIDLGVNNLATCSTNVGGMKPFLVNGRPLKSINQYYNKTKASMQSKLPKGRRTSKAINKLTFDRNNKVIDYLHKASKQIVEICDQNDIGNIVVGYNQGWKNEVGMGKRNNQNFVQIPFKKFIEMIKYKAKLIGIEVIEQEEAYTSKCDALNLEEIGRHATYSGSREKRGLFKSKSGQMINADVNGSLNILRKVIGDGFLSGNPTNRGLVFNPVSMGRLEPTQTNLLKDFNNVE